MRPDKLAVALSPFLITLTRATDKIYDSSCKNLQTLQINTANGVCDSRYFLCSFGTKNIGEYDDPTTGWSYTCTADTTSENCAGDALTYCVSSRYPPRLHF